MVDKKNKLRTELFITGIIDDNVSNKFIEETQDIIDEFTSYKMETSYIKEIMQQKFPMITVTINSPGGNIYDGNLIISRIKEMQELGIPLIANGITCMSMAFIIYIAFNKRTADKLFAGMNHSSRSHYMGYREEVRSDLDHSDYMDDLYDKMIREQTNIPEEQIEASRLKCVYYGYEEAIELGIINYGYEGCDPDWDELDEKFNQATALAIQTFAQLMDMEEGELAITLLHTGLSEILGLNDDEEDEEGDGEMEDKKECKCGGNCECDGNCKCHKEDDEDDENEEVEDKEDEDKDESSKTLGEILSKYDEDEDDE
jgi:ATP-dependent protease ClpP protease subunit